MDRHSGFIYSPEAAFRLGYDQGDERRRRTASGKAMSGIAQPRSDVEGFEEEWERGYRAGLRGEPAPTTLT